MKYTFEIMKEYEDAFRGISVYSVSEDKKLMVDFVALEELEDAQKEIDEAYQRGLDDAWEAAKKILQMYDFTVFGLEHDGVFESPLNEGQQMTPQEAIEKLKAYEEKQKADDKIEVGDEVADKDGDKTIVTNIHGDLFDGLCSDGSTMTDLFLDDNHKTGRHFDIASILEDMRCGQ